MNAGIERFVTELCIVTRSSVLINATIIAIYVRLCSNHTRAPFLITSVLLTPLKLKTKKQNEVSLVARGNVKSILIYVRGSNMHLHL